uniref:Uncharacterized protein n=1 Tax=Rangifer tarandus platyrhynchus TaxID=3082113 RepID=A0ACB0EXU6_RANTA|nr:unnamed protein product [Rangifer tarandus platyrhynchus]
MNLEAGSTSLLHSLKNSKFRESMTRDDRFLLGLHESEVALRTGLQERGAGVQRMLGGLYPPPSYCTAHNVTLQTPSPPGGRQWRQQAGGRYGGGEYWGLEKVSSEQASLGEVLAAEQGHAWSSLRVWGGQRRVPVPTAVPIVRGETKAQGQDGGMVSSEATPQLWDPNADTWVQDRGSVVSVGAGCAKESWDQTSSCSEEKI